MSTTFDVYPSIPYIPTFDEVLSLSNINLKNKLEKHGIVHDFQIDVQIRKNKLHIEIPFLKGGPAVWNDDEYAWFIVAGSPGGCDANYWEIDEPEDICDGMFMPSEIISDDQKEKIQSMKDIAKKCESIGYQWYFRRSVGQPAIINLSYGMIAAAFAKLTNGIIFSGDSAWDDSLFPAQADEFLLHYFDPDCPDRFDGQWAAECLDYIKSHPFGE